MHCCTKKEIFVNVQELELSCPLSCLGWEKWKLSVTGVKSTNIFSECDLQELRAKGLEQKPS